MKKAEELNAELVQLKHDHWLITEKLRHKEEELRKILDAENAQPTENIKFILIKEGDGRGVTTTRT